MAFPLWFTGLRTWHSADEEGRSIPSSLSGFRPHVSMSGGVSHRCDLDLTLLWLWCGLAAAALIQPLMPGTSICHRHSPKKEGKQERNKLHQTL